MASKNPSCSNMRDDDIEANEALDYIVKVRAPYIRERQVKAGVKYLGTVMIQAFMEFYPEDDIKRAVEKHFFENGLFPTREMLFEKLESSEV